MIASYHLLLHSIAVILWFCPSVQGLTTVTVYSDSRCQLAQKFLTGHEDGYCQLTLAGVGSFQITDLRSDCAGESSAKFSSQIRCVEQ